MRKMLKMWVFPFVAVVLTLQGCAVFLVGTAGVLGGMAISEDTVQSDMEADYRKVLGVTLDELEQIGTVTMKDEVGGRIEAKVKSSEVVATLEQATDKVVRLRVKARKRLLPNVKLAHEIVGRVLKRL